MNLYKKYYPIKDYIELYNMSEHDVSKLIHRIKRTRLEMIDYNYAEMHLMTIHNPSLVRLWKVPYKKPIEHLCNLLRDGKYIELDNDDLNMINEVLYRYKYGSIISMFIVPKRTIQIEVRGKNKCF